ncbi:rsmC [Acrasis kona]|uniref:RsmC n=1 Tax=Acrasis kona TaxID=1008807 RepID=A0AAW2YK90_9EUKA
MMAHFVKSLKCPQTLRSMSRTTPSQFRATKYTDITKILKTQRRNYRFDYRNVNEFNAGVPMFDFGRVICVGSAILAVGLFVDDQFGKEYKKTEWYRNNKQYQATNAVIIATIISFFSLRIAPSLAHRHFAVSLNALKEKRIHTLFTSMLSHNDFKQLSATVAGLYLLSDLELKLGVNNYLALLVGSHVIPVLCFVLFKYKNPKFIMNGMSTSVFGLLGAHAIINPNKSLVSLKPLGVDFDITFFHLFAALLLVNRNPANFGGSIVGISAAYALSKNIQDKSFGPYTIVSGERLADGGLHNAVLQLHGVILKGNFDNQRRGQGVVWYEYENGLKAVFNMVDGVPVGKVELFYPGDIYWVTNDFKGEETIGELYINNRRTQSMSYIDLINGRYY